MAAPQIEGYQIRAEIGSGSTGIVYEAVRDDGTFCAIKVLDSMSSNSALIADRVRRISEGGAQDATVVIRAQALDARPACLIMDRASSSLQLRWAEFSGNEKSWGLVQKLAGSLGRLHSARVAHGNLKPGHVFFGRNDQPLLSDFASGLMPGVHRLNYSDALLYAPPEQLRQPTGYEDESGYRWDVYAFGVLAFRLLTGVFPRSDEVFQSVCPAPGTQEQFGIEADHEGIARGLEQQREFSWPTEALDERETRCRKIIDSCLNLAPHERPFNMREVARCFEAIESELGAAEEKRTLELLREQADRKRARASKRFLAASVIAIVLGGGWGVTQVLRSGEAQEAESHFLEYRQGAEERERGLAEERDRAKQSETSEIDQRIAAEKRLALEIKKANAELRSAYDTNEKLFDWSLEEGIEGLPVLEDRKTRLGELLKEVEKQLDGMSSRPDLKEQAGVLRLRRAELALAKGQLEEGEAWLLEAIESSGLTAAQTARGNLRYLLLVSKRAPSDLEPELAQRESSILEGYEDEKGGLIRAKAALDLVRARVMEAKGDGAKALASYLACLEGFKTLEEMYPANTLIGLMVGRRYLSAALAAEGEGSAENAANLRAEAAKAFTAMAAKQKNPSPEIQYQIATAKAAQAISMWQQGDTFGAEKLARDGVTRLTALQGKMPSDFRVAIDLASQKGIIATALRDEGKATEAQALLSKEIQVLEKGVKDHPQHWVARYLLASLKWQLSGLLGQQGNGEEELKLGEQAHQELKTLLMTASMKRPRPSEVRKSLAYLCGDLGHTADLRNQRETAIRYLKECKVYWQELAKNEGDQLEIKEGYQWVVARLAEMGVK